MPLPYYVSPEQMMQDKAEYAKKGIAKGRSIIALEYNDGILLAADNPSSSLHKVSEVYDRIAFAGAGKYSEFEHLRKAGIRHADLTGYMYSREDVSARTLSNAYSQSLGTAFSTDVKPLEVELLVVQVAAHDQSSEIYRILFDGSIVDEKSFAVIGGRAEAVQQYLKEHATTQPATLQDSLKRCLAALEQVAGQKIPSDNLEVAVLDRTRVGRKFKRLSSVDISQLLA